MRRRNTVSGRQERYESRKARQLEDQNPIPLDHIVYALQNHHWECVFELDAPRRIYERLKTHSKGYWFNTGGPEYTKDWRESDRRINEFRNAFIQSEIYCAHEGVDRRIEYGLN